MGSRRFWIGALLLAGVIYWALGRALGPNSADTEFQKAVDSLKQVKTFRGTYVASTSSAEHSERLWEVDCSRVVVHQQSQDSQSNSDSSSGMKEEELLVADQRYTRDSSGSWERDGFAGDRYSAKWYCDNLKQGGGGDLLPDFFNMLHHGITEDVGRKTVNGVRCREWKFDMRTVLSSRKGSVCIGVDDHLPYEMTMDGGRYSYSDYNRPMQFDVSDAMLQSASSTGESSSQ